MLAEIFHARRHYKTDGTPFVTFSVALRANDRELILIARGCMYTHGKISPPRQRTAGGFYRGINVFGKPMFEAVFRAVEKYRWWDKWPDVPQPVPLEKYQDESEYASAKLEAEGQEPEGA